MNGTDKIFLVMERLDNLEMQRILLRFDEGQKDHAKKLGLIQEEIRKAEDEFVACCTEKGLGAENVPELYEFWSKVKTTHGKKEK